MPCSICKSVCHRYDTCDSHIIVETYEKVLNAYNKIADRHSVEKYLAVFASPNLCYNRENNYPFVNNLIKSEISSTGTVSDETIYRVRFEEFYDYILMNCWTPALRGVLVRYLGRTNVSSLFKSPISELLYNHFAVNNKQMLPVEIEKIKMNSYVTCPICLNDLQIKTIVETNCCHRFCYECVKNLYREKSIMKCPLCRAKIDKCKVNSKTIKNKLETF